MAGISKEDAATAVGAAAGGGIGHGITSKLRERKARLWELDRIAEEKAAAQKALQAQYDEALRGDGFYTAQDARRDRKAAFARIEQESADRLASLSENFDWVGNPREAAPGAPSPVPEAPKAGRGAPAAAAQTPTKDPQWKGATAEALVEEAPSATPEMVPAERVPPAEYKARESQRRAQELKRAAREKLGMPEGPPSSPLGDGRSSFGAVPEGSSPELGRISPRDHMPRDLRAALEAAPSAPQDYPAPLTAESLDKRLRQEGPSFHQTTRERQALRRSGTLDEPSFGFRATPESAPVVSKTPAPIDHQHGVRAREVVMNPRGKVPAPPERMTIPSQSTPAPIVLGEAPSGAPKHYAGPGFSDVPDSRIHRPPTEAPTTGLRGVPGRLEDAPDYGYSAGPSTPKPKKALKGAGAVAWGGLKTVGKLAGGAALGYEGARAIRNIRGAMADDGVAKGAVTGGTETAGNIVGETGGAIESIGRLGQRAGEGLPPEMQRISLPLELGGRAISAAGRGIQSAGQGIKKGGRWWIGERAPLEAGKEIAEMQARGESPSLDDSDIGREIDQEVEEAMRRHEAKPQEFAPTPLRKRRDDAAKDAFRMSQAPQTTTAL